MTQLHSGKRGGTTSVALKGIRYLEMKNLVTLYDNEFDPSYKYFKYVMQLNTEDLLNRNFPCQPTDKDSIRPNSALNGSDTGLCIYTVLY